MKDEFPCIVTKGTRLEAYIGRRDDDVLIEVAISDALNSVSSVCLGVADARELAATLQNLADRVEKHLASGN